MPISSLPSPYGIGTFGKAAYEYADFLKESGQKYWQVLPLGPTSYGDSPYQSFSPFAGNPYFIDLEKLIEEGLLTKEECDKCDFGKDPEHVPYEKIYNARFDLLKKAFNREKLSENKDYKKFCKENSFWLKDYGLYMAVKHSFGDVCFIEWDEDIRTRQKKAVEEYSKKYADEVEFYCYLQFKFDEQWKALKKYANKKGVKLIGDIPIYVAFDSADTWANPELFMFDKDRKPVGVAGCPPDYFAATGQLWGNPLYNWEYHKKTGYEWWMKRLGNCFKMYDVVRIDHFRGFDEFYFIPYGDKTAEFGHWEKGPGYDLFDTLKKKMGKKPIIAEDLGLLTPSVIKLVKKCGYPGMKILEFAFDSGEDNDYLPHNYDKNCIVYTGTHDNDTTIGWFSTLRKKDKDYTKKYLGIKNAKNIAWDLIRLAQSSVADTCIIPMQDYLELGNDARINLPSTLGNNWVWRMSGEALTDVLADKIHDMTATYGRCDK